MTQRYERLLELARKGNVKDQKNLAYFYLNKEERRFDTSKTSAFDWFRRAAEQKDPEATYMISFLYYNGIGRNADHFLGQQWYDKALKLDFKASPKKLISLFKETHAVYPEDFSKQCDNDNSESPLSFYLKGEKAKIYENDEEEDSKPKKKKSKKKKPSKTKSKADKAKESKRWKEDGDDEGEKKDKHWLDDDSYDSLLYKNAKLTVIEPDMGTDPAQQLDQLIGLNSIKSQIRQVEARIMMDKLRAAKKLPAVAGGHHFVFSGNPGTGKNEVARILGRLLLDIGVLEKGHVVEVDRSDLVGAWVGHSALKTKAAIMKAQGGVLFIDEAYSLDYAGYNHSFGDEVMSTLIKAMEDSRADFVVVLAGYMDEMKNLLRINPGVRSRFRHQLIFEDYNSKELLGIYELFCKQHEFTLHKDAKSALEKLMKKALKLEDQTLGNGRFVRNAFEKTIEKMALRIVQIEKPTKRHLKQILLWDIPQLSDIQGFQGAQNAPNDNGGGDIARL